MKTEQEIFREGAEIGVPGREDSVSELKGKAKNERALKRRAWSMIKKKKM